MGLKYFGPELRFPLHSTARLYRPLASPIIGNAADSGIIQRWATEQH